MNRKSILIFLSLLGIIVLGIIVFLGLAGNKSTSQKSSANQTQALEKWSKNSSILMRETTSTCTLKLSNGVYRMYLMNEMGIAYTESKDAKNFGERKPTGVIQPKGMIISNPSVLKISDNNWIMIYELQPEKKPGQGVSRQPSAKDQRNLYLAVSADGKTFRAKGLAIDSSKEDNFFASVPELVKLADGKIRLYYVSGGEAIGSAISKDNGRTWQREAGYRLKNLAVDPEVLFENGKWTMYYAELSMEGKKNAIYKATSKDGLNWLKDNVKLVEPKNETGFVVDPDIIKVGDSYRMFFGEAAGGLGAAAQRIDLFYADKVN